MGRKGYHHMIVWRRCIWSLCTLLTIGDKVSFWLLHFYPVFPEPRRNMEQLKCKPGRTPPPWPSLCFHLSIICLLRPRPDLGRCERRRNSNGSSSLTPYGRRQRRLTSSGDREEEGQSSREWRDGSYFDRQLFTGHPDSRLIRHLMLVELFNT